MPGAEKLITFQGENGNLTKPLWEFKPRGQYGQDDLRDAAEPGRAGGRNVLHPLDDGQDQHPRSGREPDEHRASSWTAFPAWARGSATRLGTENQNLPAFVAIPDPRGVPQVGPNHWSSAFLPAVFQGTAFNADKPIPNLATPAGISPAAESCHARFL